LPTGRLRDLHQPAATGHHRGRRLRRNGARATGLVRVPEELDPVEAAPLLCEGVTTFNALRNADAPFGAAVAIQGIGGLGHLGIQQAKQLGYRTVGIARGRHKAHLATSLGADDYIDSAVTDPIAVQTTDLIFGGQTWRSDSTTASSR
jgi:D-arabinose 1-dehydrogenase-like Zn-dependent alcohol dehydrogenase